jgi:hypothetical protein
LRVEHTEAHTGIVMQCEEYWKNIPSACGKHCVSINTLGHVLGKVMQCEEYWQNIPFKYLVGRACRLDTALGGERTHHLSLAMGCPQYIWITVWCSHDRETDCVDVIGKGSQWESRPDLELILCSIGDCYEWGYVVGSPLGPIR